MPDTTTIPATESTLPCPLCGTAPLLYVRPIFRKLPDYPDGEHCILCPQCGCNLGIFMRPLKKATLQASYGDVMIVPPGFASEAEVIAKWNNRQ